jgi:hypothetical protein
MTMFAPAAIASSASARDWHSTLTRREKPATRRTVCTAEVMEPAKVRDGWDKVGGSEQRRRSGGAEEARKGRKGVIM